MLVSLSMSELRVDVGQVVRLAGQLGAEGCAEPVATGVMSTGALR
jgi:hypothetical protein